MQHLIPSNSSTGASASRRWQLSLLLVLFLMAPKAWAQTYLIGTNQTVCTGNIYDSGGANGDYSNDEDLTSVLTPGTAGAKLSLNFASFATESCCDYLRIYDGPTTSAPLIGEYRGTSNPGRIQASSATGQLTLVFHSDVSVLQSGFEAAITCLTNVPVISSFSPNNGPAGTSVVITGTAFTGASAVTFNGVAASAFTVNSATQITATVPAGAFTGPICVTATSGRGCSATNFSTGNLVIGTNLTTCSGTIYDSGGSGNYSNDEDLTSVLTPGNGSKVVLTFSSFSTESCCDYLRIYDGPNTGATLIGEYRGTSSPGTVQASASNATGQLTLVFHSDGSVMQSGFEAAISCLAPPTCTAVTNLTVNNVTANTARLNFTPGIGNNSYIVTYTPTGTSGGTPQTATGTTSPITLTNLSPSTAYSISIQPVCTVGTSPNTTTTATFTTLLPNDEPCGAVALSATPVSASNVSATTSVQNGIYTPSCAGGQLPRDVWFTFVPNASSSTLALTGNAAGTVRFFTTTNCSTGPFTEVFCRGSGTNNTALGTISVPNLTVGQRYYVAVSGFGSSDASGIFTVSATNVLNATKAQANTDALVVYPNPSNTGQLTIKLNELRGAGQLVMFNSLGQAVRTQALTGAAEQTISTHALAAGLYTLRVTVGEQALTRKVVLE